MHVFFDVRDDVHRERSPYFDTYIRNGGHYDLKSVVQEISQYKKRSHKY